MRAAFLEDSNQISNRLISDSLIQFPKMPMIDIQVACLVPLRMYPVETVFIRMYRNIIGRWWLYSVVKNHRIIGWKNEHLLEQCYLSSLMPPVQWITDPVYYLPTGMYLYIAINNNISNRYKHYSLSDSTKANNHIPQAIFLFQVEWPFFISFYWSFLLFCIFQ